MAERIPVFWDFNNIKLKQAQRELDRTRAKTRQLQGSANLLSKSFKNLGTTLLATFGAVAVLAAFRNILKSLKDLEFQMSKVAAISGATSRQMVELRKNAIAVGAASKFTATEVGKLQEELARLGFTTTEILKLTDSISALAIVADRELGPTAIAVAKTINAFSLSAEDAARVTNVMAESFANTALDLEKFEAAIRNVGPAAKVAGLTLEETTAILGTLVDNGIEASKSGTDLRRILIEVNKAGLTLDEALTELNLSTDKIGTGFELFGARALVAGNILASNVQKTKDLNDQFSDSTREMDNMRRIMEDNLETDLKKLASAFDALIQKGSRLNIAFRFVVSTMRDFVNVLGEANLSQEQLEFLQKINEAEITRAAKNIKDSVSAAFETDDIDGFIEKLEDTAEKEEIIALIRREQKLRLDEANLAKAKQIELDKQAFEQFKKEQEARAEQRLIEELTAPESEISIVPEDLVDQTQELVDVALEIWGDGLDEVVTDFGKTTEELATLAQERSDVILNILGNLFSSIGSLGQQSLEFQIALGVAEMVVNLSKLIPKTLEAYAHIPFAGPVLAALQIAAATAQTAAAISRARSVERPGFKEGVIDYQGQGTETSDSNLVWMSNHESMIKASATKKSPLLLEAINSGRLNDELSEILLNNKIGNADNGELLAAMVGVNKSIKGLPIHQTYITESGIARYIQKENSRVMLLRNRFINGQ